MDKFSVWLKEELKRKKWRQADLARASKLDTAVISNLVNGKRGPGEDTCKAIARALGYPPEIVFQKAGLLPKSPPETELQRQLVYLYNQLPDDEKQRLVEYAGFLKSQYDKD